MALLAAVLLLALSSALVVGTVSLAHALRRAAGTTRARARVDIGAERAVGEVLQRWDGELDSLPPGAAVAVPLDTEPVDAGPPLDRQARVAHLGNGLYAVTVDVCAFACAHPVAQRRARLWLQRPPGGASTPVPVTPWAFSDLY